MTERQVGPGIQESAFGAMAAPVLATMDPRLPCGLSVSGFLQLCVHLSQRSWQIALLSSSCCCLLGAGQRVQWVPSQLDAVSCAGCSYLVALLRSWQIALLSSSCCLLLHLHQRRPRKTASAKAITGSLPIFFEQAIQYWIAGHCLVAQLRPTSYAAAATTSAAVEASVDTNDSKLS